MVERLPMDLLCFIGYKLDSTGDRIRFRAVSTSWRSALPFRQPPLLMLSDLGGGRNTPSVGVFVSLGDQTMYDIDFPEIDGGAHVVACTGNWLITTRRSDTTILLSNPFSKLQFQLPFNQLPCNLGNVFPRRIVTKVVLSSPHDTDCIAMSTDRVRLAIARPGDASWTTVPRCPNIKYQYVVEDVIFYQQQFYMIDTRGRLVVCNITGDSPQRSFLLDCFIHKTSGARRKNYLVEWSGELLMVVRFLDKDLSDAADRLRTHTFKIYKFDLANMKFDEFECLGNHSLFLGFNTSMSVLASNYFGLVRRNCIYFADDWVCMKFTFDSTCLRTTENDIGMFDLKDNTITPLFKGASTSVYLRPRSVWIIPA